MVFPWIFDSWSIKEWFLYNQTRDIRNNIQVFFSIRSPTTRLIFITGFRSSGPTSKCHAHISQIRTQIKIRTAPRYSYYSEFWEYTFYDGTFNTHYGNIGYQVLKGVYKKLSRFLVNISFLKRFRWLSILKIYFESHILYIFWQLGTKSLRVIQ